MAMPGSASAPCRCALITLNAHDRGSRARLARRIRRSDLADDPRTGIARDEPIVTLRRAGNRLPVSFPTVPKPDRRRARPGAVEACQRAADAQLALDERASLVPNGRGAHGDRRGGRRDVTCCILLRNFELEAPASCVGVNHHRSLRRAPVTESPEWLAGQRRRPRHGLDREPRWRSCDDNFRDDHALENGAFACKIGTFENDARGVIPLPDRTPSAPYMATSGRDTAIRESSRDLFHAPDAAGLNATPSLLSFPPPTARRRFRGCPSRSWAARRLRSKPRHPSDPTCRRKLAPPR